MEAKKCFKCGRVLPLSEFYVHHAMKDGHLNKCKDCTRKDSRQNYNIRSKDEAWFEHERERGRDKYHRLGYVSRTKPYILNGIKVSKMLERRGYDMTGKEAHHWNYNNPYSVFILSRRAHHRIHSYIKLNPEEKLYYTNDGIKIESKEQAKLLYEEILKKCGIEEELVCVEMNPIPNGVRHIQGICNLMGCEVLS